MSMHLYWRGEVTFKFNNQSRSPYAERNSEDG